MKVTVAFNKAQPRSQGSLLWVNTQREVGQRTWEQGWTRKCEAIYIVISLGQYATLTSILQLKANSYLRSFFQNRARLLFFLINVTCFQPLPQPGTKPLYWISVRTWKHLDHSIAIPPSSAGVGWVSIMNYLPDLQPMTTTCPPQVYSVKQGSLSPLCNLATASTNACLPCRE